MLLGVAIGDSLGNTTEGRWGYARRRYFGDIRDYLPNPRAAGEPRGLPSDDTQLTFWTLESLLAKGGLDPNDVARRFAESRILGIGQTVRAAIANLKAGSPWYKAGANSAGNGALMRIAPVVLPQLKSPSVRLWEDTLAATVVTHNDEMAVAASVGFVGMLWECLGRQDTNPEPTWRLDTFLKYASAVETGRKYQSNARSGLGFDGTLCQFLEQHVRASIKTEMDIDTASETWFSGAYLLETVPIVVLTLARFGHSPEEAIVRAVTDTWDNDTIGAIIGAAVGALHGRSALPERWITGLLGRTRENDDGRVFELVEEAVRRFTL